MGWCISGSIIAMSAHHHDHSHCNHGANINQSSLFWAVVINVLLTGAQLVGGYMADSLSMIADAIHNFGDAGALLIALFAHRIAKLPADDNMTYGYRRSEILGALVNGTALVVISIYLLYSGVSKLLEPVTEVNAKIVIVVSFIALIIDALTALLMYKGAKDNINMKAAFLHNVMDAMTSFMVMLSGFAIMFWGVYRIDAIATLLIAVYIIFHTYGIVKKSILILMQSVPAGLSVKDVKAEILSQEQVSDVKHIHLWQLDDKNVFFEGEVFVTDMSLEDCDKLKSHLKKTLKEKFSIGHSTFDLSLKNNNSDCDIH